MLRFGLIGCGRIAERHVETLAQCRNVSLAAVCDVVEERMEHIIRLYEQFKPASSSIQKVKDYHQLLGDAQLDAVIITTISGLHAHLTKIALVANKHVIVEKPLALSIGDANDIIELASIKKRNVLVCHQLRYRPIMAEIKQMIQQGVIGRCYYGAVSIRLNRSPSYYTSATWRGTWDQDGGMLLNQGIHLIDLMNWFLGEARSVSGTMMRSGLVQKQTEDFAVGFIHYHNQALGCIEANTMTPRQHTNNSITILAEKGMISISGTRLDQIHVWDVPGEHGHQDRIQKLLQDRNEHFYMYQDFIHAIQNHSKDVRMNAKEAKRSLETIMALYQSSITHQTITLPLLSFSTAQLGRL